MTTTEAIQNVRSLAQSAGFEASTVDQYLGPWAIEPVRFRGMVNRCRNLNLTAHFGQVNAARHGRTVDRGQGYGVTAGGCAIIQVRGPMMKFTSSLTGGTSTVLVRRAIREASNDDAVKSILLVIDSPGGTVAGTMDLADEVKKAAAKKRTVAFVDDLTASAAYWIASQAERIYANNATALVGSIGTYAVLYDQSKAADKLGVKVHVIKAGAFKGTGVPGTEITDDQVAEMQRIVDSLNAEFLKAVQAGRSMTADNLKAVADGRIHPAREAIKLRLVDEIKSYHDTVAMLERGQ